MLLSGDIADHGLDAEYEQVAGLLADVAMPLVVCPGNHDVRARFVAHLGESETVLDIGDHRLVALNSLVTAPEGERIDHGALTDASLRRLEDTLSAGRPTFVALHHPPVDLHVDLMDRIKLADAHRLEEVVRRHDNVIAILVGHAHAMTATTFAGVPVRVGGGLVSTIATDLEDLPTIDYGQPPTIALHILDRGHLVTHWRAI